MKVCVINYSSRKNGNGMHISNFIMESVAKADAQIDFIDFSEITVHSCGKCNYECFDASCIYRNDDIDTAYRKLLASDLVISVVPIYGGLPCSNFSVFSERAQGACSDTEFDRLESLQNKYIIIGNTGFDITKKMILENDHNVTDVDFLSIRSNEVGERSVRGNLMDYAYYRELIGHFLRAC